MKTTNVIVLSHAKQLFVKESREKKRIQQYADNFKAYHVIVFTLKKDALPPEVHNGSLHIHGTHTRTKLGALIRAYFIGRNIKKRNPKQAWWITSQDPFESALVARLLRRPRDLLQIQIHGDIFNPYSYQHSLLQRLRVWYAKRAVCQVDSIRVVSRRIKRSVIQRRVPEERITVLPIQADLDSFMTAGTQRQYRTDTPLRLLYVGRLSEEKNIPLLLETCRNLSDHGILYALRIVGSGPLEQELQEQVRSFNISDQVTFVPWTDDVVSHMLWADVFCLTSHHEGWGMVLLEAAATGLPSITTDVGCVGEVLFDQESALVAPVGDTAAYTQATIQLVDGGLRKQLGQSARAAVQQNTLSTEQYLAQIVKAHSLDG